MKLTQKQEIKNQKNNTQREEKKMSKTNQLESVSRFEETNSSNVKRNEPAEGEAALERIEPFFARIDQKGVRKRIVSATVLYRVGDIYAQLYNQDRWVFKQAFDPGFFNVEQLDDIEDRALVFWWAYGCLLNAGDTSRQTAQIVEAAKPIRAKLLKAAEYIWGDHPIRGEVIANIRAGRSYTDKARDLMSLGQLFMDNFEEAESR